MGSGWSQSQRKPLDWRSQGPKRPDSWLGHHVYANVTGNDDKSIKGKGEEISKEVMALLSEWVWLESCCSLWGGEGVGSKNLMTCAPNNFRWERKNNSWEVAIAAGRIPLHLPSFEVFEARERDCWTAGHPWGWGGFSTPSSAPLTYDMVLRQSHTRQSPKSFYKITKLGDPLQEVQIQDVWDES